MIAILGPDRDHRACSATWRSGPEGQAFGNLPFLAIMVGLTLLAVVVAVFHPIAWTDEEMWLAARWRRPRSGAALFFGALALGRLDHLVVIGPVAVTPLLAASLLASARLVVYAAFRVGGALGYGPLAATAARDDPCAPSSPRPGADRLAPPG